MNTYPMSKQKKISIFIVLSFFIFTLFPTISLAEESELNFNVKPHFPASQVENSTSYFDLNLAADEKDTLGLTLTNSSSEEVTIKITAHTAYTNVNGVVEYGKTAAEKDPTLTYAMEELIEVPEPQTLAAGENRTIDIPIQMPKESFEGLLAGGLRIEEVREETDNEEGSQGLAINNKFSFVIGVLASNNRSTVIPELELLDVFPDQLNYRNVFSATIQNTTATFVNRLEVDAVIRAEGKGEILYQSETEKMQMAPNSQFNYPIPLNGDAFRNGDYVATITARSGEHEWTWDQKFTINQETASRLNRADVTVDTSMNWWMIAASGLFILLLIVLIYLLIKRKKDKNKNTSTAD